MAFQELKKYHLQKISKFNDLTLLHLSFNIIQSIYFDKKKQQYITSYRSRNSQQR